MSHHIQGFSPLARLLHWSMALLILAMLFIGVGMVVTLSTRHTWLVELHKPLGIALLALVLLRIAVRLRRPPPALPPDLPGWQHRLAHLSHLLLYTLMLAMPLVGWAMLAAGGYPVVLLGWLQLPAIAPHDAALYAVLRQAHHWLGYLLFATVLLHLGAALFHGLIRRDGVLASMVTGNGER
ncbi:cytochrome b [Pseudomonas sp. zfem005]|uniref:cytochrome b n=1 Tax=Pseudomonas sp. zfem005 TaxID=3078200 RepID=UPI002929BCC4|nr:cytochrome b [Pseudomonas sp. zfem005]MDU9415982.1 cytochrome b [Pseudomonas sp. zfem005]